MIFRYDRYDRRSGGFADDLQVRQVTGASPMVSDAAGGGSSGKVFQSRVAEVWLFFRPMIAVSVRRASSWAAFVAGAAK